jgi:hypothetical protein
LFKENKSHEAPGFFSVKNTLPDNLQKRYDKSWAKYFYENVFNKIDEEIFKVLFSDNYSRPNTPINIYVSLEILKELFGLTDEELLERFHFDNLFFLALGLECIGEKTISDRAFYYMRSRVSDYEYNSGLNLFHLVFKDIRDDYIDELQISKKLKRIDSTLIGSNIRRLNRIKLFLETLKVFLKSLDKKRLKKLVKKIKGYIDIDTENYVYKLSNEAAQLKIEEIAEHLYKVKWIFKNDKEIHQTEQYQILERVVNEHLKAVDGKNKKVELKDKKELSSGSLQSPYDPDATYKTKGNQAKHGYSITASETCDKNNKLQIITDVVVGKNNVDDSKILEDNFEEIMEDQTEELIADGAYLNNCVREKSNIDNKKVITTAIRGRKPKEGIVNSSDFKIENNKILKCPRGKTPVSQEMLDDKLAAKFSQKSCEGCTLNCIIRKNKKRAHVLILKRSTIENDKQRQLYKNKDYLEKCKLRPAVEGTMFQIKLYLRNGKSKFRRIIKVRSRAILRSIAINYKRVHDYKIKKSFLHFLFWVKVKLNLGFA